MEQKSDTVNLNKEQYSVYSCICYFNVFSYPVKAVEICDFMDLKLEGARIVSILNELQELGLVFSGMGHYSLDREYEDQIRRRYDSELRFHKKQKTISRFASLIARFPFVESVAISGSCSKGLLEEEGDVDYFIITTPGKLWLCRTLLIAFKKVFLLNSKKYFCLNYFVDADNLTIPDKNLFVANEIKTLTPISNKPLFEKFLNANEWTNDFLPNKSDYSTALLKERPPRKYFFRMIEFLFNNSLGTLLDGWCFNLTFSTWRKRFAHFNEEDFSLNFRSTKRVSKHHPRGFQKKVLGEMGKNLQKINVLT